MFVGSIKRCVDAESTIGNNKHSQLSIQTNNDAKRFRRWMFDRRCARQVFQLECALVTVRPEEKNLNAIRPFLRTATETIYSPARMKGNTSGAAAGKTTRIQATQ